MTIYRKLLLIALLVGAISSLRVPAAENPVDIPPLRMANGGIIEGTVQEAIPDGLVIQGENGRYTAPWKYLSAGTRYRYELPMLAAQETKRVKAIKKAQAAADAKKKATAAKAAAVKAAAVKAAAAKAAGVVSNLPPVKK